MQNINPITTATKEEIYYFDAHHPQAAARLTAGLTALLPAFPTEQTPFVFLCIGSDRSTGDSLGPLTGYKLAKYPFPHTYVYGTLYNPVHALNLQETYDEILHLYENPFIIAIDASLGARPHIGCITLANTPLKPGLGVKKDLPQVGDLSITGIVNHKKAGSTHILQATRLSTVMNMSDCIVKGIRTALLLI